MLEWKDELLQPELFVKKLVPLESCVVRVSHASLRSARELRDILRERGDVPRQAASIVLYIQALCFREVMVEVLLVPFDHAVAHGKDVRVGDGRNPYFVRLDRRKLVKVLRKVLREEHGIVHVQIAMGVHPGVIPVAEQRRQAVEVEAVLRDVDVRNAELSPLPGSCVRPNLCSGAANDYHQLLEAPRHVGALDLLQRLQQILQRH
mmetsp:Transcript_126683/g.370149  ORF Transcript_126683/g.370149 Transcript_126683/m.370149 type:complete len:206 (-) Transcript_126683:56-673(-)